MEAGVGATAALALLGSDRPQGGAPLNGVPRLPDSSSHRGRLAAVAGVVVALVAAATGLASGKIDLSREPRAAATAGCSRLPSEPPPIPPDPVLARFVAGTVAIASPQSPPGREMVDQVDLARVDLRIETVAQGFDTYSCSGVVTAYIPWIGDRPVPPELVPSPGKRLLVFIGAMKTRSRGVVPALTVPPVQVASGARFASIEGRAAPMPTQSSRDLPAFSVGLAAQRVVTVMPDPQLPLQLTLYNTTNRTLDASALRELGISRWTVSLSAVSGTLTTGGELDLETLPTLEPGASHAITVIATFKESVDKKLQPGNAVLSGQLQAKSKPVESPGSQVSITEL